MFVPCYPAFLGGIFVAPSVLVGTIMVLMWRHRRLPGILRELLAAANKSGNERTNQMTQYIRPLSVSGKP